MRNRLDAIMAWLIVSGLAVLCGGCGVTMSLTSLNFDPETTASVARNPSPLDPGLDEEDWRRAQAALSLAVDPQGGSLPVNWDNPASKRKGSFTAAGNMVLVENSICRPFTATVLAPGAAREIRYRGEACRVGPGDWALKSAEPLVEATASTRGAGKAAAGNASQPLPARTSAMLDETQ